MSFSKYELFRRKKKAFQNMSFLKKNDFFRIRTFRKSNFITYSELSLLLDVIM